MGLTAAERVLVHLHSFWNAREPTREMTQAGIAEGARILRSHVPRALRGLETQGLLNQEESHVRGQSRRARVYRLTEAGIRRAREIVSALDTLPVDLDGRRTSLGDARRSLTLSPLSVLFSLDAEGRLDPRPAVRTDELLQREADLAFLRRWLAGPARLAVVYGSRGIGKTSLARTFVRSVPKAVWIDVNEHEDLEAFALHVAQITGSRPGNLREPESVAYALLDSFARGGKLLVLDGYGDVHEQLVETFSALVRAARRDEASKILVLAQETTPAYCRFYGRPEVDSSLVAERHLRGLDLEGCRLLLGNPTIDEESLRQIYLLTKGCPLYLRCIRDGDAERLRLSSRFTNAEIRLLLYSGRAPSVTPSAR